MSSDKTETVKDDEALYEKIVTIFNGRVSGPFAVMFLGKSKGCDRLFSHGLIQHASFELYSKLCGKQLKQTENIFSVADIPLYLRVCPDTKDVLLVYGKREPNDERVKNKLSLLDAQIERKDVTLHVAMPHMTEAIHAHLQQLNKLSVNILPTHLPVLEEIPLDEDQPTCIESNYGNRNTAY